jgi:putative transposase
MSVRDSRPTWPTFTRVTDAVMDDVRAWQQRPLEEVYPVTFLDCQVLKVREGGIVQRRAWYLAFGVTVEGDRDVLGMWLQETEGASSGCRCSPSFASAAAATYRSPVSTGSRDSPRRSRPCFPTPGCRRASCIVHLIRHSLRYVPRRERKQVARDLKPI